MTVVLHSDAEVARAWDALDQLYAQLPEDPRVAGARAAAEWTTGRIATSPITAIAQPPTGDALAMEGPFADMVVMGLRPGDREFAAGVTAWMFWFVGLEPLPRWLR